ncbi:Uncharacterised protein [Mycobacteroides abscessus subsp. abscessus]|nr:Uncharacterised protein [Mycobacteroides abscessus subsp. abscessus]
MNKVLKMILFTIAGLTQLKWGLEIQKILLNF